VYINLTTGTVKTNHHAQFDKAWYLQPTRPPEAQLLYDLGLEFDDNTASIPPTTLNANVSITVPWPPLAAPTQYMSDPLKAKWTTPLEAR
jgi:hypothetical protein